MRNSPLGRVLFPLGVVLLLSVAGSLFLRDIKLKTAPAAVPHKLPALVSRVSDVYQIERALGRDGTVYTLRHYEWLSAQAPDGTQKWETRLLKRERETDEGINAIAVSRQGLVYAISGRNGRLYGIGADGKVRWKKSVYNVSEQVIVSGKVRSDTINRPSHGDPVVGPSGDVYVLLRYRVVSFGADGRQKYDCELRAPDERGEYGNIRMSGLQVAYDGTAYVTVENTGDATYRSLRAVSREGEVLGQKPLEGWRCHVSPYTDLIVDQVGDMVGGKLIAYDHNWRKQWEAGLNPSALDFDAAGITYALTREGRAVALGPAGRELWSVPTTADIELSAAGTGPVYVLDQMKGLVTALDRASGKTLWDATPAESDKVAAVEAQAREYGESMGYAPNGHKPQPIPFATTYLMVDQQGKAYFSGTANWLFAAGP